MTCRLAHLDGSYVLGALSPAERQQFEQHLDGCRQCARAVRELAGLPGLLGRVDLATLESPGAEVPVPETLLPALVREVRRTQRRRFVAAGALAAVVTGVVAVGGVAVVSGPGDDDGPAAAPPDTSVTVPAGRAMTPLGYVSLTATLAFEPVAWGTRLDLTCTYVLRAGDEPIGSATYALVVRTRDGRTDQVATWRALPGRTMRLTAATAADRGEIAAVEVRTGDGRPVLRLTS